MKKLALVLLLTSCLPPQRLESPCRDRAAELDEAACPACETDADCSIVSNACYETATCAPTAGNWAVTLLGCNVEHPPPVERCGCVERVCQAK